LLFLLRFGTANTRAEIFLPAILKLLSTDFKELLVISFLPAEGFSEKKATSFPKNSLPRKSKNF
jgi:hypothetical protein